MNSYQLFEQGDIVRLRDDLTVDEFYTIDNKNLVNYMIYTLMAIDFRLRDHNEETLSNTYVQILEIIDNEFLLIQIVDSDKQYLINTLLYISLNFIDKETLRMIFVERNTRKRVRRHDFKIKNNKYGKSKFFHKDKR